MFPQIRTLKKTKQNKEKKNSSVSYFKENAVSLLKYFQLGNIFLSNILDSHIK